MRTTLSIDDDVLDIARQIAAAQSRPLGEVVSDLARRGLSPASRIVTGPYGFPVVRNDRPHTIRSAAVADAMDE